MSLMLSSIARILGALVLALPPLLGAWLASSLAAYLGASRELAIAAAVVAFAGVPVLWELVAARRRAKRKDAKPHLFTTTQRLTLRTFLVNLVLVGALVCAFPKQSFPALAVRGDWMLEGRTGHAVDVARDLLHKSAEGLAWLYTLTRDDPYKDFHPDDKTPDPVLDDGQSIDPDDTKHVDTKHVDTRQVDEKPKPQIDVATSWPLPAELHPAVKSITPADEKSLATVALYLRGHSKKGADRIKALHDYVANRVAYDADAYRTHTYPPQDAETVWRTRTGVCAGYAALFLRLGQLMGEHVMYLTGDAAGAGGVEGHAWNAALVDGNWQLVDVTWDAGYVNPGAPFVKRYDTAYLFAPPDFFAASHFPDDAHWQLLAQPMSRGEFLRAPKVRAPFHRAHMKLVSPNAAQIDARGSVDVVVENPLRRYAAAEICGKNGGSCTTCTGEGKGATRLTCPVTRGQHELRFFVAETDDSTRTLPEGFSVDVNGA